MFVTELLFVIISESNFMWTFSVSILHPLPHFGGDGRILHKAFKK